MIASRGDTDTAWLRTVEEVITDLEALRASRRGVWPMAAFHEAASTIIDLKRGKRISVGKPPNRNTNSDQRQSVSPTSADIFTGNSVSQTSRHPGGC